jgi:hypothetical protein
MRSAKGILLGLLCLSLFLVYPKAVWGQTPAIPASQADADDDATPQPTEPDFVLINLPTTLRLPTHKGNFRLTHRFQGNLRQESFGHQASNLFGLDNGAAIGFEFRYAVARRVQAAIYRTNIDKATQFYGKFDPIVQSSSTPVSISALVSIQGSNNFRRNYAPAVGAVISRKIADRAAAYATPIWVHNSAAGSGTNRETVMIGLGGRLRLRPRLYAVAEVSPRVAGYVPGDAEYAFALEGRVGGHVFQVNFSNTVGTTFLQTAQGGFPSTLFLGFNIARKFY